MCPAGPRRLHGHPGALSVGHRQGRVRLRTRRAPVARPFTRCAAQRLAELCVQYVAFALLLCGAQAVHLCLSGEAPVHSAPLNMRASLPVLH